MIEKLVWWMVYIPHWIAYQLGFHGEKGPWGAEWFALGDLYQINRFYGLRKEQELYVLTVDDVWEILRQVFPDVFFTDSFEGSGKDWFNLPSNIEVDNYFYEYWRKRELAGKDVPDHIRSRLRTYP